MTIQEERAMGHARRLLTLLRSALSERQLGGFIQSDAPIGEGRWHPLPKAFPSEMGVQPFGEIIVSLDQTLSEMEYDESVEFPLPADEFWTLGSITKTFPIRSIHRGFVEPVLRLPIIPRLPQIVVAFLLKIPDERDLLKREHHNQVGWHYHYLNFRKARSNIVLCWDTRADRQKDQDHPLFQETHGEGRADFQARTDLWGDTKKESMHIACAPDLDNWPLSSFRCASNKAGPVWPLTAILTRRSGKRLS